LEFPLQLFQFDELPSDFNISVKAKVPIVDRIWMEWPGSDQIVATASCDRVEYSTGWTDALVLNTQGVQRYARIVVDISGLASPLAKLEFAGDVRPLRVPHKTRVIAASKPEGMGWTPVPGIDAEKLSLPKAWTQFSVKFRFTEDNQPEALMWEFTSDFALCINALSLRTEALRDW
jgi:hypothetical protein